MRSSAAVSYFTTPRPVHELYDIEADPCEINNPSGKPELVATERELRAALAGKVILDWDYLPLPDLMEDKSGKVTVKKGKSKGNGK